jgi:hypothetical protein
MPLMMKYAVLLGSMAGFSSGDRRWQACAQTLKGRTTSAEWVVKQIDGGDLSHVPNRHMYSNAAKVERQWDGERRSWEGKDWVLAERDPPGGFTATMRQDRREEEPHAETLDRVFEANVRKTLSLEGFVMEFARGAVAQLSSPDVCRMLAFPGSRNMAVCDDDWHDWYTFEGKWEYNGFSVPLRCPADAEREKQLLPADDLPPWTRSSADEETVMEGIAKLIQAELDDEDCLRTPSGKRRLKEGPQRGIVDTDGRMAEQSAKATGARRRIAVEDSAHGAGGTGGASPRRLVMDTPRRADMVCECERTSIAGAGRGGGGALAGQYGHRQCEQRAMRGMTRRV